MKIKSVLLSVLIIFGLLNAVEEVNIKEETTQKIEKVTKILQDKSISSEDKSDQVFELFDNFFDFERMSSLSLGKAQWNSLTKEQQQQFNDKFIHKLKQSFVDKLELYTDEKIDVGDIAKPNNNRVQLPMTLINSAGEKYDILYKFYDTKTEKAWLIYDVDILGVSIIQTYRSQFDGVLNKSSFEELLQKIDTIEIDENKTK